MYPKDTISRYKIRKCRKKIVCHNQFIIKSVNHSHTGGGKVQYINRVITVL